VTHQESTMWCGWTGAALPRYSGRFPSVAKPNSLGNIRFAQVNQIRCYLGSRLFPLFLGFVVAYAYDGTLGLGSLHRAFHDQWDFYKPPAHPVAAPCRMGKPHRAGALFYFQFPVREFRFSLVGNPLRLGKLWWSCSSARHADTGFEALSDIRGWSEIR